MAAKMIAIIAITGTLFAPLRCEHREMDVCQHSTGDFKYQGGRRTTSKWKITQSPCNFNSSALFLFLNEWNVPCGDISLTTPSVLSGQSMCHYSSCCILFSSTKLPDALIPANCQCLIWKRVDAEFPMTITFRRRRNGSKYNLGLKYVFVSLEEQSTTNTYVTTESRYSSTALDHEEVVRRQHCSIQGTLVLGILMAVAAVSFFILLAMHYKNAIRTFVKQAKAKAKEDKNAGSEAKPEEGVYNDVFAGDVYNGVYHEVEMPAEREMVSNQLYNL